jgi:hypothetical protein
MSCWDTMSIVAITLKTDFLEVMSKSIKDLSLPFFVTALKTSPLDAMLRFIKNSNLSFLTLIDFK